MAKIANDHIKSRISSQLQFLLTEDMSSESCLYVPIYGFKQANKDHQRGHFVTLTTSFWMILIRNRPLTTLAVVHWGQAVHNSVSIRDENLGSDHSLHGPMHMQHMICWIKIVILRRRKDGFPPTTNSDGELLLYNFTKRTVGKLSRPPHGPGLQELNGRRTRQTVYSCYYLDEEWWKIFKSKSR